MSNAPSRMTLGFYHNICNEETRMLGYVGPGSPTHSAIFSTIFSHARGFGLRLEVGTVLLDRMSLNDPLQTVRPFEFWKYAGGGRSLPIDVSKSSHWIGCRSSLLLISLSATPCYLSTSVLPSLCSRYGRSCLLANTNVNSAFSSCKLLKVCIIAMYAYSVCMRTSSSPDLRIQTTQSSVRILHKSAVYCKIGNYKSQSELETCSFTDVSVHPPDCWTIFCTLTYRFRYIRCFRGPTFWFLGDSWGYRPKGENTHPGHICRPITMQNFTPIGATVAEISVTGHSKKYSYQHTLPYSTTLCMAGNNSAAVLCHTARSLRCSGT